MDVNYDRRKAVAKQVETLLGGSVRGKTIGMLGLAFKENTDDMRDAPSVDISNALIAAGARVRGYDPVARQTAAPHMPAVEIYDDVYKMTEGCDALIVVTPWNEFKQLDLEKVKRPAQDADHLRWSQYLRSTGHEGDGLYLPRHRPRSQDERQVARIHLSFQKSDRRGKIISLSDFC